MKCDRLVTVWYDDREHESQSLVRSRIISPHIVYQWLTALVIPRVLLQLLQVLFDGAQHHLMANDLAWIVVVHVVGLITTLCKVQQCMHQRNQSPLRDWIPWVGRPIRSPWRDWLICVWVGRVVGDQATSITFVILMSKQNELNFGAWASTTTILFVMLEEVRLSKTNAAEQ